MFSFYYLLPKIFELYIYNSFICCLNLHNKMRIIVIYLAATFGFLGVTETFHVQADESDIKLYYYSISNPTDGILTNISDPVDVSHTAFSNKKDTVFCIHGWGDKAISGNCLPIKNHFLEKYDINIFIVNWDTIANNWLYLEAFNKVEAIGDELASLLKNCVDTSGLDLGKITIVGHSLGAHVAGVAGVALNGKLGYIVGLDPAGPFFTVQNTKNRLTTSSAKFVQVIHTCGGRLGYFNKLGHADYYPNGGKTQQMCGFFHLFDGMCSHLKSLDYYVESILTGNFKAKKCDNYHDYKHGICDNAEISMMGEFNMDKRAYGSFFLDTNNKPPYAKS